MFLLAFDCMPVRRISKTKQGRNSKNHVFRICEKIKFFGFLAKKRVFFESYFVLTCLRTRPSENRGDFQSYANRKIKCKQPDPSGSEISRFYDASPKFNNFPKITENQRKSQIFIENQEIQLCSKWFVRCSWNVFWFRFDSKHNVKLFPLPKNNQ